MLSWTYKSAHGIPEYPSFAAAYKADMAEYGHPSTPGYVYEIMPVLEPVVRITARSSVNVGSVESSSPANREPKRTKTPKSRTR